MKKTVYNYFYQLIFQAVKIMMPIVSIPIASKALGANGIGLNSYTNSIAQYFILLSALGVALYGNREIAIKRNQKDLTGTFIDIFIMKAITTSIFFSAYLIFIVLYVKENQLIFLIQSIYIIAVIFDVSWFFMGIEDFKRVSISSLIAQIFVFSSIVFFVKDPTDIYLYAFILAVGNFISQVIPMFFLKQELKDITLYKFKFNQFIYHFTGTLKYFVPQIGILLYSTVNRTLLGLFSDIESVGYYTNSMSLVSSIITLITAIDMVMLPKISNMLTTKNNKDIIDRYIGRSLSFEMFVAIPAFIGITFTSTYFVPWFFGNDFKELQQILPLTAVLLLIVPFGVSISRQYLIPLGNTKDYTRSVLIGGCLSVIIAVITIPVWGVYGAIYANIVAELFVSVYRLKWANKNTNLKVPILNIIKISLASILMMMFISVNNDLIIDNMLIFMMIVLGAVFVYLIACFLLKVDEIKLLKEMIKR